MSFNLGQFRRNQLNADQYISSISYSLNDLITTLDNIGMDNVKFPNKVIKLNSKMQNGKNYYIRFEVRRDTSASQNIVVSLQNAGVHTQTIGTYYIPSGSTSASYNSVIELIISPITPCDEVVLTLQRRASDFLTQNVDGTYGRKMTVSVDEVAEIYNVLDRIGHNPLNKIGVQGPPGMLMCINGEDIRIGPSGVYEINNGYKINFLGFIVQQSDQTLDKRDYFVLDYRY